MNAAGWKRLLAALAGETVTPPPVWMMRQAGRYLPEYRALREKSKSFLDFCYRPELAVEATLQPLRRYRFDAAILFSDILVVADGLGQKVEFKESEGPVLEAIRDRAEVDRLDLGRMVKHLAPVYETVSQIRAAIPSRTTLIGFAGAPWTVAIYMVEGRGGTDCATTKKMATADSNTFARLIEILVEATVEHLSAQISNGAETVQLFDSWAGVLNGPEFDRWIVEPTARIVARLKDRHPEVPVIGFPRGCGDRYADYASRTGIDGIGIDENVAVDWAARELQPHCTVQGNLSNRLLVAGGKAMDDAIDAILATLGKGRFVFNLGHGIVPETPPENVARAVDRVLAWKGT